MVYYNQNKGPPQYELEVMTMTLRELFKKIETYNEVAKMMRTQTAWICFMDGRHGDHFKTYKDASKYIRREYIPQVADMILKYDGYEIDGEATLHWTDSLGTTRTKEISTSLTA